MDIKQIDDFKKNNPKLLSFDEVLKITKSIFSISPYWIQRKELLQIVTSDNFLFAFKLGVIVTKSEVLFLSSKKLLHIDFIDISKIMVNLKKMTIIFEEYEILIASFIDDDINLFLSFQEMFKEEKSDVLNENIMKKVEPDKYEKFIPLNQQIIKFCNKLYKENQNESFVLSKDEIIKKNLEFNIFSKGNIWQNTEDYFIRNIVTKDPYYVNNRYIKQIESGFFGLISGVYVYNGTVNFIYDKTNSTFNSWHIDLYKINTEYISYIKNDFKNLPEKFSTGLYKSLPKSLTDNEKSFLINLFNGCISLINKEKNHDKIQNKKSDEVRGKLVEKLKVQKQGLIGQFDKNNDGNIDLIDGEVFNKLLNKHQKSIIEIDKNYIQKFVKISQYLKNKKRNTQKIFESINKIQYDKKGNFLEYKNELEELPKLLKNQIHTYELLVFHSISMITSLIESDLITFYEIYESFDQLSVFNSNWENEVSNKLSDIGEGIKELMYSINSMEDKIVHSLDNLTYTTMDSFSELNNSITSQLSSIDSSINFNNLLTGIQTYQMYKINKNTKRIN
jgi:hypothetical protein